MIHPDRREDYDSEDEWQFSIWCREAVRQGIIYQWGYHPNSVEIFPRASVKETRQLKTKTKEVDVFLFHPLTYQADFILQFTSTEWRDLLGMRTTEGLAWIDIKGNFSKFHDDKQFSIIQKCMWNLKGIYVNKTKVKNVFSKTFVPEEIRYGKSGKELKKWKGFRSPGDI